MLDWFLSWAATLAFVSVFAAPLLVFWRGSAGVKWAMMAITLFCAANFYYYWTVDFEDEVLVGNTNSLGLIASIVMFILGIAGVAIALAIKSRGSSAWRS